MVYLIMDSNPPSAVKVIAYSLNIFNCLFNNGVGLQVLTTLVTARPLQHLYTTANMAYIKHLRYNKHVYIRSI